MSDLLPDDSEQFFPDDDDRPETEDPDRGPEVGRLVEPQSGVDELDTTAEAVAADIGADDGDLAPEERAMHIEEAPYE
jgi:hypothetical protein